MNGGLHAGEDCGHKKAVTRDGCSRMELGHCRAVEGGGHGIGESAARLRAKTLAEQDVYLYRGLALPVPCITIGCVLLKKAVQSVFPALVVPWCFWRSSARGTSYVRR